MNIRPTGRDDAPLPGVFVLPTPPGTRSTIGAVLGLLFANTRFEGLGP